MFFMSRFKESNKAYVDPNMTRDTLHFPTMTVKNANIKQFKLNKVISWIGLKVLAQRNN